MEKVLAFAKTLISTKQGDRKIAIDATCGRGNDTLFLASIFDKVFAFDIQDEAIESTKKIIEDFNNVDVIKDSNQNICTYVKEADAVMYNLGYLPNGNKNITTTADVTIESINSVLKILKEDAIITIICYPGHQEGNIESVEVEKYLEKLNQKEYDVIKYEFINQINNPPFLLAVRKR